MEQEINTLEKCCNNLYTSYDIILRNDSEKIIMSLTQDKLVLDKCLILFERKSSSYCQVVAATILQKLVINSNNNYQIINCNQMLSPSQKFYLKNYLLNYLCESQPLESYVNFQIIKLIVILIRYGWLDTNLKILNSEKENDQNIYLESKLINDLVSSFDNTNIRPASKTGNQPKSGQNLSSPGVPSNPFSAENNSPEFEAIVNKIAAKRFLNLSKNRHTTYGYPYRNINTEIKYHWV